MKNAKAPEDLRDKLERVRTACEVGIRQGREHYAKQFGKEVDDKSINRTIDRLYKEACDRLDEEYLTDDNDSVSIPNKTVAIPLDLVLALTLRDKWQEARGRKRTGRTIRRFISGCIREALKREAELIAGGTDKHEAQKSAAADACARLSGFYGIIMAMDSIRKRMREAHKRIDQLIADGVPFPEAVKRATDELAHERLPKAK